MEKGNINHVMAVLISQFIFHGATNQLDSSLASLSGIPVIHSKLISLRRESFNSNRCLSIFESH